MTPNEYLGILDYLTDWLDEHDREGITRDELVSIFEALAEGAEKW